MSSYEGNICTAFSSAVFLHNAAPVPLSGAELNWTSEPHVAFLTLQMHEMRFLIHCFISYLANIAMATSYTPTVTRIACFRFKENVTAEQKGDRARAFLNLYAQHQDLILGMPKGGKPLNTPLNLTNVKRDSIWDTGFTVTFKVSCHGTAWIPESFLLMQLYRAKRQGLSLTRSLGMIS